MSHFVKYLLPQLLSPCFSSLPPPLASQVEGTKTQGEEAREEMEDVQTETSHKLPVVYLQHEHACHSDTRLYRDPKTEATKWNPAIIHLLFTPVL